MHKHQKLQKHKQRRREWSKSETMMINKVGYSLLFPHAVSYDKIRDISIDIHHIFCLKTERS